MSLADKYFIDACTKIINEGFDDTDYQVRPTWPDGVPAHTKKIFGYVTRYDLSKEFPALTLRKQAFKTCVKELLWMWQKKSNKVSELDAHIWDAWQLEDGTIGKTYSYQLAQKYDLPEGDNMDQIDALLYNLKHNPMNRRMIVTMWNPRDLKEMNKTLMPCVYEVIFDVQGDKLNMILMQRSADALAAGAPGGYDEIQYAMLQCMIAQSTGYKPGEFLHVISNMHIYDRHEEVIKSIMKNPIYEAPKLWLNPEKTNFYDFTVDDFKILDYQATKLDKKFEVAE